MKINSSFILLLTLLLVACNDIPKYATYEDYPVYEGSDLELTYTPLSSKFRVWAPTATQVKVLLYDNGYEGGAYKTYDMDRAENGTWTLKIDENLKGKFYTFQIRINEKWMNETPGIWVKATGANGKRAAIIDFADTNPDGWENDTRPKQKNFTDIILYELHVRDFSMSPNSGIKNRGKYLAFTETGTKSPAGESTGIDHLKELGVTHVNLLPVFDFASIDETRLNDNKYNWGYSPVNFNVPEGSYSTDPYNPVKRILEFKRMVQSLHKAGIRVAMDVAYNHTSTGTGSHLDLLAPGYFYRLNADSTLSNASGCGNETASERAMMRKLIVESVVYWATEYHIDGFRFDLMGIHDIETMNAVRAALDNIDPTIAVYGEGRTAGKSPLAEEKRAVKKNAGQLNNIALFDDDIRNALIGSLTNYEVPGFVSGTDSLEESVKFGIVGAIRHPQVDYTRLLYSKIPYASNPSQAVNYVSFHDDMCLLDKLRHSMPPNATESEIAWFDKLAQTVVFTSQGMPFIYAGEELYRTKKGVRNSVQSPDSINRVDWNNKTVYKDIFNYYQGLIALRKAHSAFRIPDREMVQGHLKFLELQVPNVVAFTLTDHVNGDSWRDILVILNGNRKAVPVQIPEGEWSLVCHDGQINLSGISVINYTSFVVQPSSASIMYQL
ncbi:MAG TPA: type I pullulanase [Paludibacter sp.]|nr:type I pullulanase [Paludibacter sp.]